MTPIRKFVFYFPTHLVLRSGRFSSFARFVATALVLSGCAITPMELDKAERDRAAVEAVDKLFAGQDAITKPLSLYEATARAVKYQTDYRVRIMEEAAAFSQIEVARFDMLPKLTANAGYTNRSNDAFGFGFTPAGTIATNPSASVPAQDTTANIGFVWNVMDFGVSYFRAKQLADQKLIAAERRRKAVQNLIQDVRLAWWRAEAAQRLLPLIDAYFEEVDQIIEKTRIIESRKLLPPMQTASFRRSLLDLQQQISLRREELAQAKVELAALVNAPPGTQVSVMPPTEFPAATLDLKESIEALEAVALRNRPELAEEIYKTRISENEAKKALLGLFPNLNLSLARNWDNNPYLVNSAWTSTGIGVAFNLVKAFSLPAVNRSSEAQARLDEARRLAMAMAVLTQTRIAAIRYGLMVHEYGVWDEATEDDKKIVGFLESSTEVGIDTELELIRAKGRYAVSKINRDIMYANLEAALGRIYNSTGLDPGTAQADELGTAELADQMTSQIAEWQKANFSLKVAAPLVTMAIGNITGVPDNLMKEFRTAVEGVLGASKLDIVPEKDAKLQVLVDVNVSPLKGGGRPAQIKVKLVDSAGGAVRYSSEFKTMLSEPVDEEQWRTLGEGAAYRVLGPILRLQAGRTIAPQKGAGNDAKPESKPATSPSEGDAVAIAVPQTVVGIEPPQVLKVSLEVSRPLTEPAIAPPQSEGQKFGSDFKLALGLGTVRSAIKLAPSVAENADDPLALRMDRAIANMQPERISSVTVGGVQHVR